MDVRAYDRPNIQYLRPIPASNAVAARGKPAHLPTGQRQGNSAPNQLHGPLKKPYTEQHRALSIASQSASLMQSLRLYYANL